MKVRRIAYALGAEVTGIDLGSRLDDAAIAEIREAWLEHVLLCFPEQDLSPEQLIAFSSRFGELDDLRLTPHVRHPDHPTVMVLASKAVTVGEKAFKGNVADSWHTDLSFTDRPTTASFLTAKDLPDVGGNTMWANMYLAYETLSPAFRRTIDGLEAVHDVSLGKMFQRNTPEVQAERLALTPPITHPLVLVHPETGRKALYVGDRIRRFVGMTEEETKPILDFLNRHATRYEFVYRHAWRRNDLVMWDNRCALHCAVADYDPSRLRRLIRCSILPAAV